MKFPLPERPFTPLELSEEYKQSLATLTDEQLQATLEEYETLRNEQKGKVDLSKWKYVRKKHDVDIYQSRIKLQPSQSTTATSRQNGDSSSLHQAELDTVDAKTLLWYGTMTGNLNDVMYGVVCPTVALMRLKSTYVPDNIADSMVLATITAPTPEDPFRGLQLKWCATPGPHYVRPIIRPRDSAYVESTGITLSSTGERIGYHFFHTLTVPGVKELPQYKFVRAHMSLFHLFRQKVDGVVEVYVKSVVNLMGKIPPSITVLTVGDAVASLTQVPIVAEMKKLNWLINSPKDSDDTNVDPQVCCGCQKDLTSHRSTPCAICKKRVCRRCKVVKKVSFVANKSENVVQQTLTFCAPCLESAVHTDSHTVAASELARN